MTLEQYESIMKLAAEGKTGIEIVKAVNEATPAEALKETTPEAAPAEVPTTDHEKESQILEMMHNLDKRITTLQETMHAVNIINSSQPAGDKDTDPNAILENLFKGATDAK